MTRPAPACRALLNEANDRYPGRSKKADGIVGDDAHSHRPSGHNAYLVGNNPLTKYGIVPAATGYALAVDLTHDLEHGCDAHALARDLVARNDPRIAEAISEGHIWTRARAADGWRPYAGKNGHYAHAHLSLMPQAWNSTDPWWTPAPKPRPGGSVDQQQYETIMAALADLKTRVNGLGTTVRQVKAAVEAHDRHLTEHDKKG